ncbi:MAG: ubiquinone/menaquinone biosynthesis methyltransferase [Parcubacteria group bacterium Gr01-1014_70]|nr:MAG: ubiquinone/menaquinone biosynthesis methyltransferase [Parcubacteria group bacterium Gr01-1014_70]
MDFMRKTTENAKLIIPKKSLMIKTNVEDPVFFHYYPITRILYRRRLKNTLELLKPFRFKHVLEIGYGSGIFLPTLARLADAVTALDIHTETAGVQKMLDWYQLSQVKLVSGDLMQMPFPENSFDGCVIISTLENIEGSERAVKEIARVVQLGGNIIVSFPVTNAVTNLLFRMVGYNPEEIHPSDQRYILGYLEKNFTVMRTIMYPSFATLNTALYISVHCYNDKLKQDKTETV